jgi:ATP-dependent exoDNAse (exonuclease V) beta subunit
MLKIVKASAGSGKTYTLVREYLRLALRHPTEHFRHILAITFTNKAANEMKSRVIEKLQALSDLSTAEIPLIDYLCSHLSITRKELQHRSCVMLQAMLHHYSDIAISTIDSFTLQIVRGFAYELKHNLNTEVEIDSEMVLRQVVELLIDEIEDENTVADNHQKKNLSKALVEFAMSRMDAEKSWKIDQELLSFSYNLLRDDTYLHREVFENTSISELLQLQKELHAYIYGFEKKIKQTAERALQLISQNGLTESDFWNKGKSIYGYFKQVFEKGSAYDKASTGSIIHLQSIQENKWSSGKKENPALNAIKGELTDLFYQILSYFKSDYSDVVLAKLIYKNIFPFMLLQAIDKTLQTYKRENGLMLLSEFQQVVFSEVKQQPVPIIFERVGNKYDHIMVDEFQDTSVMQWHNLLPLVDNAVSNMNECLMVGDAKQAIYRFRGGEVRQFAMLPRIFGSEDDWVLKEREINILNHRPKVENLDTNYRSCAHIVDFNNRFYKLAKEFQELEEKSIYDEHEQKCGSKRNGGNVWIAFVEDTKGKEVDERFEKTLQFVHDALLQGYEQRDLAILVQTNKTGAEISSFLIQQGFRVVSPESLFIAEADSVKLLESALKYIYRTDDVVNRAEFLLLTRKQFNIEKGADDLPVHGDSRQFDSLITNIIQQDFHAEDFHPMRLFDLLNRLTFLFRLNIRSDPFVQFFLDEVLLYTQRFASNLQHFLEWWEAEKTAKSIVYPETLDAIKVMTVHKSKGLEFPVVILPDADYSTEPSCKDIWVEIDKPFCKGIKKFLLPLEKSIEKTCLAPVYKKEQADTFLEKLNLLYVATTRPTDLLYIITSSVSSSGTESERIGNLKYLFHEFVLKNEVYSIENDVAQVFPTNTADKKTFKKSSAKLFTIDENLLVSGISAIHVKINPRLRWKQNKLDDIAYGNLLHQLLSKIDFAENIEEIIRVFFAAESLGDDVKQRLADDVYKVITNPDLQIFFSRDVDVFNETPLSYQGSLKIPDRVVFDRKSDVVHILDYKTGEENPAHTQQMLEYKAALKDVGCNVCLAAIFYTQKQLVLKV